jgi:hypothetical protein
VIIFWRWRKREPKDNYLQRQYKTALPGEEHAGSIRELYKSMYMPKPGVMYDDDTGLHTSGLHFYHKTKAIAYGAVCISPQVL